MNKKNAVWGITETSPAEQPKPTSAATNDSKPEIIERVENELYFYSEIYRDSVLTLNKEIKSLNNDLSYKSIVTKNLPADIFLYIQSYGGSIFSGLSVMDNILSSKININTIIDGCAASAATLISVVGHKRYIKKHSYILIHQLSSIFWGNYEQLKDDMENSHKFMKVIKDVYKKHTKIPMKKLDEILKHDLWLDAEESLYYGLVDYILT